MADIKDSPISKLTKIESSLSGDLLLLSQRKANELGQNSVGIEYTNFVSSVISAMGSELLSSIVKQELSSVIGGTITLATWSTTEEE